ncbi:MAG: hypothetical protein L3K10_00265 [Thermoplasmata archaeon]|nr:hypothetical protein [Thermoplasmata archaeon]
MGAVNTCGGVPPPVGSILISGVGERSISILVAALARRDPYPFGWADCSRAGQVWDAVAQRLLAEGSDRSREVPMDLDELRPPPSPEEALSRLVAPDPAPTPLESRLAAFLRLPVLFQRLASRTATPSGRSAIVLTNVDSLPANLMEAALGPLEIHETLHAEGVTLLVTFRGTPPSRLEGVFDQGYRVEAPVGSDWQEARVARARGNPADGLPPSGLLREWLPSLGLTELHLDRLGDSPGPRPR